MEIAPGVHQLVVGQRIYAGLPPPNVFLVVGEHSAVFIDTGYGRQEDVQSRLDYWQGLGSPQMAGIIVTHRHPDHMGGAAHFHQATSADIICHPVEKEVIDSRLDEASVGKTVSEGDTLDLGGTTLEFIDSPGHTMGSLAVFIKEPRLLFAGDTILGFGTTAINPDEGDMALYIETLRKYLSYDINMICPGHGQVIRSPQAKINGLIEHRMAREKEILGLVAGGKSTIEEMFKEIYPELEGGLGYAARRQIKTHLIKLEREGRVEALESGETYAPAR